ncbi:unnamed protein product [Paramecium pentaurelia]|uniref:Uncharacterized protein n=1 Tax=Paramecium pentaurelia TaxID=43138 RepID=A0A8S1YFM3_9CILI|nr:unnamed protein product [Paramecium pentaurelia]
MQVLEFHIYESQWMLRKGKYKCFVNVSEKHLTHHYQQTELPGIQLQMQLIRRLLYCRLKIMRKHFLKFNSKQGRILTQLDRCMQLCHTMQNYITKCQDVLTEHQNTSNRKSKYKLLGDMQSPRGNSKLKQFLIEFEHEPWDKKSLIWLRYHEQELFISIQQILMFNYLYFKMTNLKEANRFLHKLIQLKFVKNEKSVTIYHEALTLLHSAYFENSYVFQNQFFDTISDMLVDSLREYYRPNSNQKKCKRLMKHYAQLLIINLDLQSKSLEYKDKYDESALMISMANYLCQHILTFVGKQEELINYIKYEYEYKHEKYEQIILEQQDLNQFVSFLYGFQKKRHFEQKPQFPHQSKYDINNKNVYLFHHTRAKSDFKPIKDISKEATRDGSLFIPNTPSCSKDNTQRLIHKPHKQKRRRHQENQSYLSKLIYLRSLSDYKLDQMNVETDLQKHLRGLEETLHKLEHPNQFKSIDQVFNQKIESITFEKCLTLDQVKETAKKIIAAEWEVHKEMPVTKSLMKSISVSDIQLEKLQQQYSKLQEYIELQKIDYHNTQKDQAQLIMKENKDLKKLQLNQQQYQMKLRHQKVQQQLSIPKKLLNLQTDEAGLSPKFIKRNTLMLNSYNATIFDRMDPATRQNKEYKTAQKQLMDMMVSNLEQRDELNSKKLNSFINISSIPKSVTRLPSPKNLDASTQRSDHKKSFAFSNNSTRLEITKF